MQLSQESAPRDEPGRSELGAAETAAKPSGTNPPTRTPGKAATSSTPTWEVGVIPWREQSQAPLGSSVASRWQAVTVRRTTRFWLPWADRQRSRAFEAACQRALEKRGPASSAGGSPSRSRSSGLRPEADGTRWHTQSRDCLATDRERSARPAHQDRRPIAKTWPWCAGSRRADLGPDNWRPADPVPRDCELRLLSQPPLRSAAVSSCSALLSPPSFSPHFSSHRPGSWQPVRPRSRSAQRRT